jgi:hypothetical protein
MEIPAKLGVTGIMQDQPGIETSEPDQEIVAATGPSTSSQSSSLIDPTRLVEPRQAAKDVKGERPHGNSQ